MTGLEQLIEPFDQLVKIEKGPVNSAIIDLVRGKVFQVPNHIAFNFRPDDYRDIGRFMKKIQRERNVIDIDSLRRSSNSQSNFKEETPKLEIHLRIEEGANLRSIIDAFSNYPVTAISYYGRQLPALLRNDNRAIRKDKDFRACEEHSRVNGHFQPVDDSTIRFNKHYNSCWGTSIAFTADGKIRPCIHSQIVIDSQAKIALENVEALIEQMNPYWRLTKDKVNKCLDCEFRYICFDCREIAWRQNGDILAPNPACTYNPFTGHWNL